MEFPSYVPRAVRMSMAALLEGEGCHGGGNGWTTNLERAEIELLRIQLKLQENLHDEGVSNTLRIEYAKAADHRDRLAAEVACCQRLVHDPRMQPAYALLVGLPGVTDAHLSGFIYAAWAARMDYAKHREKVKAADELAREVAKAAGALAGLLSKAEVFVGPYLPSEFFSIRSLLEGSQHDVGDRNFYRWSGMRDYILGEPEPDSNATTSISPEPSEPTEPPKIEVRHVAPGEAEPIDPEEERRATLRNVWNTAPSMAQLVATLQREALKYTAAESGAIAAAIASRQHSGRTAYLRAFGALLQGVHHMPLTTDTIKAMATTAAVVLNDPGLDVTYDDARKALTIIKI